MNSLNFHSFNVRGLKDHKRDGKYSTGLRNLTGEKIIFTYFKKLIQLKMMWILGEKNGGQTYSCHMVILIQKGLLFCCRNINVLKLSDLELY